MKANQAAEQSTFGSVQIGILLLALATSLVHLVLLNIQLGKLDLLFTLNGLGYLGLLAAYFLPLPFAKENRGLVRWGFMAFTLVTIIAWLILGDKSWWVGWATKGVEVVLIGLLWMDNRG